MATDVEHRRTSVCSDETVPFTNMKLQNDTDVRTMISIFSHYMTKRPIKLETKQLDPLKLLTFDEITTCMVGTRIGGS
ncbi:hypothetical protein L195_g044178 [Trifolium pratense]|uniref:Uncharacterized protein n=1 Tax=Trifolium pratense TaxID=57577 RepID=A0A2K3MBB9_TRIPR|nr:hypothetical protein L195_g044178 [Trifolium pratense]